LLALRSGSECPPISLGVKTHRGRAPLHRAAFCAFPAPRIRVTARAGRRRVQAV